MRSRALIFALLLLLLPIGSLPTVSAHKAPFPYGYNPTRLDIDTVGDPESLDPAWAYDTASEEVIMNVYETLISFDRDYTLGPYSAGQTGRFVLRLAVRPPFYPGYDYIIRTPSPEINPITSSPYFSTLYFAIRENVYFPNDDLLTPADVEYSFERGMIQDRDGGPQWMLFEALLGEYFADSGPDGGVKINNAVEGNATTVWFNFVAPYPQSSFMQILSQPWASVVCKAWAISRGDFDGDWSSSWTDIYRRWHNPEVSFLDSPRPEMVGTGPYRFSYWTRGIDYSVVRNPNYWGGWPAALPARYYPPALGGYIEAVIWREISSWSMRRANLLLNDPSDDTYIPRTYRDQVLGQIVGGEKIRCFFPVQPVLSFSGLFFTFDLAASSRYMGAPLPPGTFGTNGIPPDIFSDINVRKGFAYAFNYATYLAIAFLNEGTQPPDPVILGLAYDNPANSNYFYNPRPPLLYSAEYYLKLAWGGSDPNNDGIVEAGDEGDLWTGGMKFQVVYNIGNVPNELAMWEIVDEINSLNPAKFFLKPLGLSWGSELLPALERSELPIFFAGWSADFADPHDLVFPFQHSQGTFAARQRYSNPVVDALIQAGMATPDDTTPYNGELDVGDPRPLMTDWREETDPQAYISSPPDTRWPRRSIYYALQAYWYDDVPGLLLVQPVGRHWEQAWMRGWYYNPLYGGSLTGVRSPLYVYHLWKAKTHFGDVSSPEAYGISDGKVDVFDAGFVSAHWSSPSVPPGGYGYHPTADINGGLGATVGGLTGPVRGMPDGKVDVVDLGLVSAYWDGPPSGQAHPYYGHR